MIKLFTKNFSYSFSAMVAFCVIACTSDNPNFVGTAEEPNQFAYGNGESSSTNIESSTSIADSSEEQNQHLPNSSSSKRSQHMSSSRSPQPKSASTVPASSNASIPSPHEGNFGHAGTDPFREQTLDYYLQKYKVPGEAFDENVLAYNKTFEGCDVTNETCFESPGIAEFRKIGLHKAATQKEFNELSFIFPTAAKFMGGSLYKIDGCPLYVLNINETSPAVHILTKITKDTLTVATFYDNCDYERRPFDMYVGFLFSYCGELSEKPEIVITSTLNEAMTPCGSVEYKEYISQKILPVTATLSPIQD
ncbi:MAG: hypothetical protein IJ908_02535 [Fibrobacter sp.]|nr:hypothetical protein [Fibrobacter sp.]